MCFVPEPFPGYKVIEQGNHTRLTMKAMELGYFGIPYKSDDNGVVAQMIQGHCGVTLVIVGGMHRRCRRRGHYERNVHDNIIHLDESKD